MVMWVDVTKMVVISSLLSLLLGLIAVLLLGLSERAFLLLTPTPKWPIFVVLCVLWAVSLKAGYWWVFQRYTFYGR